MDVSLVARPTEPRGNRRGAEGVKRGADQHRRQRPVPKEDGRCDVPGSRSWRHHRPPRPRRSHARLRRADRPQRRRQPAPHDHARRLPRRRRALRHRVRVRRRRRRVRQLIPLPGIPTNVERGGDWTLQRLIRETEPVPSVRRLMLPAAGARDEAEVLLERDRRARHHRPARRRRRGRPVGHGARLPAPARAPEVLDFYANRSPIFLAAVFDADAAAERGQPIGDGTPSTSPSRPTTRGCRSASWAWARPPASASRPTSTC